MKILSFCLCFTFVAGCVTDAANDTKLSQQDIATVERICRSLIGVETPDIKNFFNKKLSSFVRSSEALSASTQVDCSFRCGGTLLLRGGAEIWYGYPNEPIDAPHRVDTVALHVGGRRVFAHGPGLESYPYPYAPSATKRR